ncbi:LuxR C-terminal-related transcriptional regulator [Vibrio parahaemolyticus]|uniref:LuxR C-terminal-related transcriptional regulator n=1 Tax=Vibrio parahaemolyticus TaxID=670 RepID=UPI00041C9B31|nr:LuxR C-terminal-related transcriptional regulator [Vibrio parahaemolyticus]MCG9633879.1 LuxR C-terminal-related transcriptional regulator [Vibrio parahaemolyticus]MDF4640278.1 LuxR C-terminal-related transcriptional regulator [Vibrio parahaemolyticus]MDG2640451.1 LuxR C-terminal-related transcriptional regulator [Vibrio parahaemolyticus]MDG2674232.1 LuxR C-terminal-related transcriptional regulator [Vibrio parahaemolyticus]TOH16584.1 helix-turn-helix transcriptional regulator [Vibrio paraha
MMNTNTTNNTVLLFTFNNIQGRGLQTAIEQNLEKPVLLTRGADVNFPSTRDEHYVAIVDSSLPELPEVKQTLSKLEHVDATVLVNAEPNLRIESLLTWSNLKGLFYFEDDFDKVMMGLKGILNGENWLSRDILNQLIGYLLSLNNTVGELETKLEMELTRREMQVLTALCQGGSNLDIADSLFVSEHTVKSHLYSIFRKLEVKNRMQAITWAKRNLL